MRSLALPLLLALFTRPYLPGKGKICEARRKGDGGVVTARGEEAPCAAREHTPRVACSWTYADLDDLVVAAVAELHLLRAQRAERLALLAQPVLSGVKGAGGGSWKG